MSLEALVWALRVPVDGDVNDAALRTLAILADYANDDLIAYPSNSRLTEDRGVDRSTIYRHLAALLKAGLILPGPSDVVAHIPGNRRPKVWFVNAWHRGRTDATPETSRGRTPQGVGVASGATGKEEPRTSIETSTHTSPAHARASELVEFPDRECVHGHPGTLWRDPKSGLIRPRCPQCRHLGDQIILDTQGVLAHV